MANYLIETVNFKREDAFKNGSLLSLSESEIVSVSAPFRKWGSTVKVRVPWGNIKLWNFIASIETTGTDEPTNWQDNIFLGSSLNRVGRGFNHKLNILVSAGSAYFLMHA